jgi:hypothetical protein
VTAVGLSGEAAAGFGVNAGTGIYFTPDGREGTYLSLGDAFGIVKGASLTQQVTVMRSYDDLVGLCTYTTIGGGGLISAGGSLVFGSKGEFVGLVAGVGVSVGEAVAAYAQMTRTWASTPK